MTGLNRDLGYRFHFVASCRTTYWSAISHLPGLRRIELGEDPNAFRQAWLASYRRSTVAHVLAHAGVPISPDDLAGVRDVPVFAAFMAYLVATRPEQEQAEIRALRSLADFERWVTRRLRMTLRKPQDDTGLVNLAALLPLGEATIAQLSSQDREVHAALAQDGWVERYELAEADEAPSWRFFHDVLADRILLTHLLPAERPSISAWPRLCSGRKGRRSAADFDQPPADCDDPLFTGISWKRILDTAIERGPAVWTGARDLLARTTLLAPEERLASFLEKPEFWADAQTQPDYQLALGWLARWALKDGAGHFDEAQKSSLVGLIEKAAPHVTVSNMPLTWGLRLGPSRLEQVALAGSETRPTLPQTHYLLVAWLDSGLDPARVQGAVELGFVLALKSSQASFLICAWLDAGGDKGLVEQPIRNWLGHHQTAPRPATSTRPGSMPAATKASSSSRFPQLA